VLKGIGKDFSRGLLADFAGDGQKVFSQGEPTVMTFHFAKSKLREKQFSTKKLIGKYQITKSRGVKVTLPSFRLPCFCIKIQHYLRTHCGRTRKKLMWANVFELHR